MDRLVNNKRTNKQTDTNNAHLSVGCLKDIFAFTFDNEQRERERVQVVCNTEEKCAETFPC